MNLEKKKHHDFLCLWVVKRRDFVSPKYTLYTYSKGASGKYCLLRDRVIMTGVTPRFGQSHGKDFRAKMTGIFQLKTFFTTKSFAYAAKLVAQAYFGPS